MAETVTIQKVIGSSAPWQDSHGNTNVDWSVQLTDGRTVTRGMREGKSGPNDGDVWEVESWEQKGDFPPKAKGVKFISGGGGQASSSGASQGALGGSYQPPSGPTEDQVRIVRQHTQKAAVDLAIARDEPGDLDWIKDTAEELEAHVLRQQVAEAGTPSASPPVSAAGTVDDSSEGLSGAIDPGEPSGALTPVEVLKAKLEHKISPDEFQMLLTEAGVADISEATDAQMVGLMNRIEQQSRKAAA